MPVQLQNHRHSNAKLFDSASGQKQKLHTAASFQKAQQARGSGKNVVVRASSGNGKGVLGVLMQRRRHSMNTSLMESGGNGSTPTTAAENGPLNGMTIRVDASSAGSGSPNATAATAAADPRKANRRKQPPKDRDSLSKSARSSLPNTTTTAKKAPRRACSFGLETLRTNWFGKSPIVQEQLEQQLVQEQPQLEVPQQAPPGRIRGGQQRRKSSTCIPDGVPTQMYDASPAGDVSESEDDYLDLSESDHLGDDTTMELTHTSSHDTSFDSSKQGSQRSSS